MLSLQYQVSYQQAASAGFKLFRAFLPIGLLAAIILGCLMSHPYPLLRVLYTYFPPAYARVLTIVLFGFLGMPVGALVGFTAGLVLNWFLMREKWKESPIAVELFFTDEGVKYQSCGLEFYYTWESLNSVRKIDNRLMFTWQLPCHVSCFSIPSIAFENQCIDDFYSFAKERQNKQRV